MGKLPKLTIEERILLVLVDNIRYRDEFEVPPALTQDGLSDLVGANRPNVSRSLGSLRDKGMIYERIAHITGQRRRKKVYMVSEKALDAALGIRDAVSRSEAEGGRIDEIAKRTGLDISHTFLRISQGKGADQIPAAAPPSHQVERPFFGRAAELSFVRAWAKKKGSPILVIYGIAGIGKTSLVEKALEGSTDRIWVRIPRSSTMEGISHQIELALSGKGGLELHASDAPYAQSQKLSEALSRSRTVLVLDDLHYSDGRFMELMSNLVHSDGGFKVICTTRVRGSFYSARDAKATGRVAEIELKGLSKEDSEDLLRSRHIPLEQADDLWKRFGGHPIALLLASGREGSEATRDVSDFIRNDVLNSLPEPEISVLRAISILRRPIPDPYPFLRRAGIDPSGLERLMDRGMVESYPAGVGVHALIGSVVSERIPRDEWARLHSIAADNALAAMDDYPTMMEALHHLAMSGRRDEFLSIVRSRGSEALGEGFMELLLILEEMDISGMGPEDRTWIHTLKAEGESLLGNVGKARSELDAAMPFARTVTEGTLGVFFMERMGSVLRLSGDAAGAMTYLTEGLKRFKDIRDPSSEDLRRAVSSLNCMGLCQASIGRTEEALKSFRKGIALARSYDPGGALPALYLNIGRTHIDSEDADEALKELSEGLDAAREANDPQTASLILTAMGDAYALRGSHSEALTMFERALHSEPSSMDLEDMAASYSDSVLPKRRRGALVERIGSFLLGKRSEEDRRISGIYARICRAELERSAPPSPDIHRKACTIFKARGMGRDLLKASNNLGSALMRSGDHAGAISAFGSALDEEKVHKDPRARAIVLYNLGKALSKNGSRPEALNRWKESHRIAKELSLNELSRDIEGEIKNN